MKGYSASFLRQKGMVLLISLVFLWVISLIGLASMQGAVSQQKIAASLWHRSQSFQSAESGLRLGEWVIQEEGGTLPLCQSISTCAPPKESNSVIKAGTNPVSAVAWVAFKDGLYGLQSLGRVDSPPEPSAALFRVTAIGFIGQSRTVLETVYAHVEEETGVRFRRVLWRQLQ